MPLDEFSPPGTERLSTLQSAFLVIGSAGLVVAMLSDALAVLGRHAGFTLTGSIELVQASIVVIATSAILLTTLSGGHAAVHIFTNRADPRTAARLAFGSNFVCVIAFLLLSAGSAWVAWELWATSERTEELGIALRWLRLLWIITTLAAATMFARLAITRRRASH